MGVGDWFSTFCTDLRIDQDKRTSISNRTGRLVGQLNHDFRSLDSKSAYRFYVGSYGRGTAIPSVSDVDLLYELPAALYAKYDGYASNGQSALLNAVRDSLRNTYPTSAIAGDGQVVAISFNDGIKFEVLPAFLNQGGGYTFADSNGGGSWRTCKPKQEMEAFSTRNVDCNRNLVELARMVRAWRDTNNVPMREALLSLLVDMHAGREIEEVRRDRDRLNDMLEDIYKGAPRTDGKAYEAAQKALKAHQELFFTDSELDHMLPQRLRSQRN